MAGYAVEFIGGPLDGFAQLANAPDRLPATTGIPVNPSLLTFMFMDGHQDEVRGCATSIAVYELLRQGDALQYCHLRSVAEEEFELQRA